MNYVTKYFGTDALWTFDDFIVCVFSLVYPKLKKLVSTFLGLSSIFRLHNFSFNQPVFHSLLTLTPLFVAYRRELRFSTNFKL